MGIIIISYYYMDPYEQFPIEISKTVSDDIKNEKSTVSYILSRLKP